MTNYYLSRSQLHALIYDAYRLAWAAGYAAHMADLDETSDSSFQRNIRELKASQLITDFDFDLSTKKKRKEFRARQRR